MKKLPHLDFSKSSSFSAEETDDQIRRQYAPTNGEWVAIAVAIDI